MTNKHDFYFKNTQRSDEYNRGEYYSVIDVLEEATESNATLSDIRDGAINYYKKSEHELFSGIENIAENTALTVSELISISNKLDSINDSLFQIGNILEVGFEAVISQLESTNDNLERITEIILNPTETKSAEFARRALNSQKNGWFEESISDFKNVIDLDPLNYPSWYYLGINTLEIGGNTIEAKEYLTKAAKYSKPNDKLFYSKSLYQLSLISRINNQKQEALDLAEKSFESHEKHYGAAFLCAELSAELKDKEKCIKYLSICEPIDFLYYTKSYSSPHLSNYAPTKEFFNHKTKSIYTKNLTLNKILIEVSNLIHDINTSDNLNENINKVISILNASSLEKEDYLSQRITKDIADKTISTIEDELNQIKQNHIKEVEKHKKITSKEAKVFAPISDNTIRNTWIQKDVAGFIGIITALIGTSYLVTDGWNFTTGNTLLLIAVAVIGGLPIIFLSGIVGSNLYKAYLSIKSGKNEKETIETSKKESRIHEDVLQKLVAALNALETAK